jgi:hypothetical protein
VRPGGRRTASLPPSSLSPHRLVISGLFGHSIPSLSCSSYFFFFLPAASFTCSISFLGFTLVIAKHSHSLPSLNSAVPSRQTFERTLGRSFQVKEWSSGTALPERRVLFRLCELRPGWSGAAAGLPATPCQAPRPFGSWAGLPTPQGPRGSSCLWPGCAPRATSSSTGWRVMSAFGYSALVHLAAHVPCSTLVQLQCTGGCVAAGFVACGSAGRARAD